MTEALTREVTIGSDASRLPTGLRPGVGRTGRGHSMPGGSAMPVIFVPDA
jgi:hypothetical protein